ncbi:F-box/LRR-repeat protein 7 [Anabrus simplex]|uniref:F-box/LRR-repeat protein 7 n=1 Tax=Anabrus simplex TaxID=316456 RepID=UPI0034DD49B0
MNVTVDMLPDDVLLTVFSYCSHHDLIKSIQHVCRRWEQLSNSKCLWNYIVYYPNQYTLKTEIIEMLRLSPKLQAVDLTEHDIMDDIIRALGDFCPELRVLHLHKYMDVNLELLKHLVVNCPGIEELTVPSEVYTDVSVLVIIKELRKLKTMIIKTPFANNNDVNIIASNFPDLEHLELLFYEIKRCDLDILLKYKRHQLRVLRLHCSLSDDGCVLPQLSVCTRLKTLSVEGLCGGTEPIPDSFLPLKSVTTLNIKCAYFFTSSYCCAFFKTFPQVLELQVSYCEADNEIIDIIALNCPLLEKITLNDGFVNDETLKRLHCLKRLNSVTITWSSTVTDEGVKSLESVSELMHLKFSRCEKITAGSLGIISCFTKLRVVKFIHCRAMIGITEENFKNNMPHLSVLIEN